MSYLLAAALGVIQGLTEFLPVSSSAHLILARAFFGWDPDRFGLEFDVALHVGTLAALLYYFRTELPQLAASVPAAIRGSGGERGRLIRAIAIGMVPTIIFGLLAADAIAEGWRTPLVCAVALAIGAGGMLVAERVRVGTRGLGEITTLMALAIGCGQAAALVPGVSRSGGVIVMAMLFGLGRADAARFSFLLGIPVFSGVGLYEAMVLSADGPGAGSVGVYLTGMVTAGLVGHFTIKHFIRYAAHYSLDGFAYYRFALVAIVVVWLVA